MTPAKLADDALALIWLVESAGLRCRVDKGFLSITGVHEAPREELVGLLKPYKKAIVAYLNLLQLNKAVLDGLDEAYDAGMCLE